MSTYTIEYRTQTWRNKWDGWQERQTYDTEDIIAESAEEAIRVMTDQYYERGWYLGNEYDFREAAVQLLSQDEDREVMYWMELHGEDGELIYETDHEPYIDTGCAMYGVSRDELLEEARE